MSTWNHRVIDLSHLNGGEPWLEICEVHYTDDGSLMGYSNDCFVGSETLEGVRLTLERMTEALTQPILKHTDFGGDE